jgi:hypothetical protein
MDAFDAHLEFMGGCMDDEVFGDDEFDGGDPCEGNGGERLLAESPSPISAMQWLRSGAPVQTAEDVFRAKFNLTPRAR